MDAVATLRALYGAWNRQDLDAVVEQLAPDVLFELSGVFPDLAPAYHGRDGFREFWHQLVETFEELSIETQEILEWGGRALVLFRFHARGRDGLELERTFAHLVTIGENGLVTHVRGYADQDEARAALG